MSGVVDIFMVYQLVKRLATPFEQWDAYKLGIIDENGNILRKKKDLSTIKERQAFGIFDTMILNLKKLIEKVPGGSSRLATYAAALYLIREGVTENINPIIFEELKEEIVNTSSGGNVGGLPPDEPPVKKKKKTLRRYE